MSASRDFPIPATSMRPGRQKTWLLRLFARHGFTLLLLLVFGFEVGVVFFLIQDVFIGDEQIQRMYDGSVLGLRRIGELQYEAQETRRSSLYALSTNDGNQQVKYAEQSRVAEERVTRGVAENLARAREPREIEVGNRLARDWAAYLKIRDQVLGDILEGSAKEAVDLDLTSGVPSFDRVRADLQDINRLYDEHASQQLKVAVESDRRSVIKLLGVLIFAFLLGSIAIWSIQRNKMRAEVQLAKLQMDFVASVSHDLRTPITAIVSAGENLRDGLVEREHLTEQGSLITEQAYQLMDLVDQVLLFAATSRGIAYLNLRPLQVSEVLESAIRNSSGLLHESGFTVEQRIQPGLPCVMADLSSLSQCLQNLIANAVKYSAGERWIGISAKSAESAGNSLYVQIDVADRGMGIDNSELAQIFEPFYRSSQAVAAHIRGTGLGLSIAKRSVEAFGGTLTVVSKPGQGSVFSLHLPAWQDASESEVLTSGASPGISK
jgi:signal transduction histidine kinase